MKKLLSGFTLAEVLITLAVIGVIAATTMPALNARISESQVGPALMKAINTLENANMLAIKTNDVRRLTQVDSRGDNYYFDDIIGPYISFVKKADVTYEDSLSLQGYTTNDGMIYARESEDEPVEAKNGDTLATVPSKYDGKYYTVYVDINGTKAPNKLGKDLFKLLVDTKGYVIPYGGEAYNNYIGSNSATIWSTSCTGSTVSDPASCTGSIVDNGGKIVYSYRFVKTDSSGS